MKKNLLSLLAAGSILAGCTSDHERIEQQLTNLQEQVTSLREENNKLREDIKTTSNTVSESYGNPVMTENRPDVQTADEREYDARSATSKRIGEHCEESCEESDDLEFNSIDELLKNLKINPSGRTVDGASYVTVPTYHMKLLNNMGQVIRNDYDNARSQVLKDGDRTVYVLKYNTTEKIYGLNKNYMPTPRYTIEEKDRKGLKTICIAYPNGNQTIFYGTDEVARFVEDQYSDCRIANRQILDILLKCTKSAARATDKQGNDFNLIGIEDIREAYK